eukprot:Gb_02524 [translate_table: standard]
MKMPLNQTDRSSLGKGNSFFFLRSTAPLSHEAPVQVRGCHMPHVLLAMWLWARSIHLPSAALQPNPSNSSLVVTLAGKSLIGKLWRTKNDVYTKYEPRATFEARALRHQGKRKSANEEPFRRRCLLPSLLSSSFIPRMSQSFKKCEMLSWQASSGDRRQVPFWPHSSWIERTILELITTYSLGFNARPKRQLIVDHPFFSPRARQYYWTINKEHFPKGPFNKAWLLLDLPRIPLPEVQRKGDMIEKEKKKKSTSKGSKALKRKQLEEGSKQEKGEKERKRHKPEDTQGGESHEKDQRDPNLPQTTTVSMTTLLSVSPINVVPPISSPSLITQIPLFQWSHDVIGIDPSIDSTFDIVLPPSLYKAREKRKGRFTPTIQILDNTLATQSTGNLISGTTQELVTRVEELELELILQAHRAREENDALSQSLESVVICPFVMHHEDMWPHITMHH